jgi:putative protease
LRRPELLAPAGDLEKLKFAVLYGADAVYLSGKAYGLRAGAGNFSADEMEEGFRFAHSHGVRVYVTVNIIAHNRDLDGLPGYVRHLAGLGVDAIIVSDPGVLSLAREADPRLEIHLSTQASTANWAAARVWKELGVSRIVLARELTLPEIAEIGQRSGVELEAFVHGAMCISYSGRCLLSAYLTGRDANLGDCAQACRWRYALVEEKRPGQFFPIEEDDRGAYIMSSRDLCLIEHIPALVQAGISSFKIEGRMKSVNYVATTTMVYRKAIDAFLRDPEGWQADPAWREELAKASHRPFTTGFYFGPPGPEGQIYSETSYIRPYEFIGVVREFRPGWNSGLIGPGGIQPGQAGVALVEQRNRLVVGEEVEMAGPDTPSFRQFVKGLFDQDGAPIQSAPHPKQMFYLPVDRPVRPFDLIRRQEG